MRDEYSCKEVFFRAFGREVPNATPTHTVQRYSVGLEFIVFIDRFVGKPQELRWTPSVGRKVQCLVYADN